MYQPQAGKQRVRTVQASKRSYFSKTEYSSEDQLQDENGNIW